MSDVHVIKCLMLYAIAVQVFAHIYVWPRLPAFAREGLLDRIVLSTGTFATSLVVGTLAYAAWFLIFA